MTTPETLGVDPVSLSGFGNEMLSAAGDIPLAPPPFTTAGADPISLKIMSALPGIETPIQTGLPEIKAEATKTASDIVDAAAKYLQTDEQLAKAYEDHQFNGQGGPSGGGGASGGGVPGAGAPGAAAGGAGAQAAGGAGGMDQMGQLMSMPMQMAGQAAQLPMQAMGALGSIPQGVMQGVQQVSQMAGGLGGADSAQGDLEKSDSRDESQTRPDDPSKSEAGQDGAASARDDAERAPVEQSRPEAGPREEPPAPTEEKKTPAQTRPAEVAQRMNL